MAEIEIQHEETDQQHSDRLTHGDLRAMLGKLARDMIYHGVTPDRADHAVAHLFAGMTMMDEKEGASIAMVLQSLRNVHRPQGTTLSVTAQHLSPNELLHIAFHALFEVEYATMAAQHHPDTPQPVLAMLDKLKRGIRALMPLVQQPMWATEPPDATDMEPAGNA
jgi:hypothetical protein